MGRARLQNEFKQVRILSPLPDVKGEHGIAAGASGLQPDDASSTLAARSMIVAEVV